MNGLGYNESPIMERNAILFLSQNHDAQIDQQAERMGRVLRDNV
jgi:hypothetical protein